MDALTYEPLNLSRVTRAERVWLWRHRQLTTSGRVTGRGGKRLSANEAAALLGFSPELYLSVENGTSTAFEGAVIDAIILLGQQVPSRKLSFGERCALARRRAKSNVEELCVALGGISKPTYYAREDAGAADLVALWRSRGYSF